MPTPTKITREQVLARAVDLLNEEGLDSLSMRELARRLDVKAPSLYRYFPDKISIERAAVDVGNQLMLAALQKSVRSAHPTEAVLAAGQAYRRFAKTKPHLYSLMMEKRLAFPPTSDSGKNLWNFVLSLVDGGTSKWDETARAVAIWSFLHGFVSLEQSGKFGASGPRDGFVAGINALSAGLEIKPPVSFTQT